MWSPAQRGVWSGGVLGAGPQSDNAAKEYGAPETRPSQRATGKSPLLAGFGPKRAPTRGAPTGFEIEARPVSNPWFCGKLHDLMAPTIRKTCTVKKQFTAVIEQDGEWHIAYCPEIPEANGQGRTEDEAFDNLAEAVELILEDRREEGLCG